MKPADALAVLLCVAAPAWTMEPGAASSTAVAPPKEAATPTPSKDPAKAIASDAEMSPAVDTSGPVAVSAAKDRIDLETTQITGNRELPRVLYVVPWKRSDLGELAGRPANSLLDEVLTPVDRDVFRRQNRYYQALKPDSSGTGKAGGAEGEK